MIDQIEAFPVSVYWMERLLELQPEEVSLRVDEDGSSLKDIFAYTTAL